jgi:UDP-2,3-diacylglucosamine pyrophosphatase LpxH
MKEKLFPLFGGIITTLFASTFVLWLFSLQGTRGLVYWTPFYAKIIGFILIAGFLPLFIATINSIFMLRQSSLLTTIIAWISFGLACIVFIGLLAFATILYSTGHQITRPIPALNLINPSNGIPVRATDGKAPYLRLAVSSDPHFGKAESSPEATAQILRTVDASGYDAFFALGDLAEVGMTESDMRAAALSFLENLKKVPIRTLMGNHDAIIGGQFHYESYFFPGSKKPESGSKLYYRIDAGKTHIIVLNVLWGTDSFDKTQKAWLVKNLESIPVQETVIVMSHCFYWASGYTDPETGRNWFDHQDTTVQIAPIFEKYGVDLVLSGHNHFMEYLEKPDAGLPGHSTGYAIIGAMGGIPDKLREYTSPWSKWYLPGTFGFLDLEIYDSYIELIFRNATGAELYRVRKETR